MSFTCSLFSDKVRCFNQSKRALYGNFIISFIPITKDGEKNKQINKLINQLINVKQKSGRF